MDTKKLFMPLSEMSISVSLKREFFSFCGNVTQYTVRNSHFCLKELANRTTRYVVITYIIGDAGWEFSGASHEIYQLNLFLTFRLCIIHLVGNSSSKNFFNIKTEIQLMIVKALARCYPHGSICTTLFSVFAVHHFWGEISQSPPLPP